MIHTNSRHKYVNDFKRFARYASRVKEHGCIWISPHSMHTPVNPFAHIRKEYKTNLLLCSWQMFILSDLTDIYVYKAFPGGSRHIGALRFEVIWVYFINALINLITPYIIWKTKTRQFICNSFHLSKVDGSFIGLVRTAESRQFLAAQHTSKEFSHKQTHFVTIEIFYMLLATLRAICTKSPELLVNRESVEFCNWTQR